MRETNRSEKSIPAKSRHGGRSYAFGSACVLLLAAGLASGQTLTNIGVPSGGSWSGASAVSGNGQAVAATVDMERAFRWAGGGFTSLGLPAGASGASADGINVDGTALAGSVFFVEPEETVRAFRWTASGGMQQLGMLPGSVASFGAGISGDGSVVTGGSFDAEFTLNAFRWTESGGMQSLGPVPGGTSSEGRRVSHDGSTIVGVGDTAGGQRAFSWTAAGGMQALPLLAPGDGQSSAFGVNANGSMVGGFSGSQATIWTNGVASTIGALPGETIGVVYALSGDGSVIGGTSFSGSNPRATLWSASTGLVDLTSYLAGLGVDMTGWTLQYTRGISLDGLTIVGEGRFNGEFRGWVATIPNPGAATLLALGGVAALRRRRA